MSTDLFPARKGSYRRIQADRFRVIELRIWELIKHLDGNSVRLFDYLWFGPHSRPYGILRVPESYVAADLGWTRKQLGKAWAALMAADLVWRDGDLVIIVPWLMSNPPANPGVIVNWRKAIQSLPSSELFRRLYLKASAWLTEEGLAWLSAKVKTVSGTVSDTVSETVGDTPSPRSGTLRNQESENRNQEQEAGGTWGKEPKAAGNDGNGSRLPIRPSVLNVLRECSEEDLPEKLKMLSGLGIGEEEIQAALTALDR